MNYTIGTVVFDNWRIINEIGEGGFGKVFTIEKDQYGIKALSALKVMTIPKSTAEIKAALSDGMDNKSVTTYFRDIVDRIMRECSMMITLKSCENIVRFEDYTVIEHKDGIGWDILIRMELLTDLVQYQMSHTLTEAECIMLAKSICRALIFCRKKGIIHRDIKPENIFISENGTFKLGDFGVSRTMEKTTGASKQGTEMYMAPEVYKAQPYGPSVDIYSLGLVLYRLMNKNRLPFFPPAGMPISFSDKENALLKRMKGEPIAPPAQASPEFADIILKSIAYSPSDRYHEASELLTDLERIDRFESSFSSSWAETETHAEETVNFILIDDDKVSRDKESNNKTYGAFGSGSDKTYGAFGSGSDKTYGAFEEESDKTFGAFTGTVNDGFESFFGGENSASERTDASPSVREYWMKKLHMIAAHQKMKVAYAPEIPQKKLDKIVQVHKKEISVNIEAKDIIGMVYNDDLWTTPTIVFYSAVIVTEDSIYILAANNCARIRYADVKSASVENVDKYHKRIRVFYNDGTIKMHGVTDIKAPFKDYYNVDEIAAALLTLKK